MSKKMKKQLVNILVFGIIALIVGIVFIPMITVSAEAVTNETFMFKFVDWFTQLKTKLVDNSAFYLLAISLITFALYMRRYLKLR